MVGKMKPLRVHLVVEAKDGADVTAIGQPRRHLRWGDVVRVANLRGASPKAIATKLQFARFLGEREAAGRKISNAQKNTTQKLILFLARASVSKMS